MENLICRKLTKYDLGLFIDLIKVYEDAFEMQNFTLPASEHLQSMLEKDSVIIYVALADEKVVGGLTAHIILPSTHFASSEMYIFDLAVGTNWQRQGIGRKLMAGLQQYCAEHGYQEIFVQADVEDPHALDFYKATGGIAESVVHFSYTLPKRSDNTALY